MGNLRVSDNKRYIVKDDGTPFFYLGDTSWELFHRLNREDAEIYFKNRVERGFTVLQAVALGEFEGITVPNAYGKYPLLKNDKGEYDVTMPDLSGEYSYWDHVDYLVDLAASYGLYIGFLPTWGDKYNIKWGKGPVVFNRHNAKVYGKWLGERYKDKYNIIWILGGDRPLDTSEHFGVINNMAEGIKEGDGGVHLMTFHPMGGFSSSHHLHDEKWMDFNMIQSGHSNLNAPNYDMVKADYDRQPVKPTMDAEPRYEDHPIGFKAENGYFDEFDVRQAAYWAMFAGAFGHTYGHHSVWGMQTESTDYFPVIWKRAILRPGAAQMQYMRNLLESRPFLERVPDQELVSENYRGANHIQATRGESYAFFYVPCGLKIKANMGRISGEKVKACWYNPRNGEPTYIGEFENSGTADFMPPSSGRKDDWVLVLDDASKNYSMPGVK